MSIESGSGMEYTPEVLEAIRKGEDPEKAGKDFQENEDHSNESKKSEEQDQEELESTQSDSGDQEDSDEDEDPEVQQARAGGWVPEDEWEGDPNDWVHAREFNRRGELMERISKQGKALSRLEKEKDELKNALKQMGEHQKKIQKLEYEKALKTLKEEKAEALEQNDYETYEELNEKYDEVKKDAQAFEEAEDELADEEDGNKEGQQLSEEDTKLIQDWSKNNTWYSQDRTMTIVAGTLGDEYLEQNPGDIQGMLKHVDREIRKEFPHKFKRKTPNQGAAPETSGRGKSKSKGRGKKYGVNDLSDEQRSIAKTFVAQGVYKDAQEYVNELAALGELPDQQQ